MDSNDTKYYTVFLFLLKRDIIYYLSRSNLFNDLEEKIYDFKNAVNKSKPPSFFRYTLKVNVSQTNGLETILSSIQKNPILLKSAVGEVVHVMVNNILKPITINQEQVVVSVVPLQFPIDTEFHFREQKFCSFSGVLTCLTAPQKMIIGSVWECEMHDERFYSEGTPELYPNCKLCTNRLVEIVEEQDTGDVVYGMFVNKEVLQMNKQLKKYEVITKITDSFISHLELGTVYNVSGILTSNIFLVWNCEKCIPRKIELKLENSIMRLHKKLSDSPWMFAYVFAMHIGTNIYPLTTFMHLKMGLLLSLMSFNLNSIKMGIPILAVGDDGIDAHILFNAAFKYTERCILPSHGQELTVRIRNYWKEAGQFILAKDGICYLGDWEKYIKVEKEVTKIRNALESGCISFDDSNIPIRCAVWTYFSKSLKRKDVDQLQILINVFGMPFITRYFDRSEDCTYFFNLDETDTNILDDDIKQYINFVNRNEVEFTTDAEKLIKDYFVASRRFRPGCLPVIALTFLTCLSESYARLKLKSYVSTNDVVAVIALYEESLNYLFGPCNISPSPSTCFTDINQVNSVMTTFYMWLKNYIEAAKVSSIYID